MNSTLIPLLALAPYAAVALGLVVTLTLFLSLKVEMQRTARRERRHLEKTLARLEEAEGREAEPVFVPVRGPAGINVSRRAHAMRLLRKGENVSHVAAALGVPRREVELLVRVQNFVSGTQVKAAGAE